MDAFWWGCLSGCLLGFGYICFEMYVTRDRKQDRSRTFSPGTVVVFSSDNFNPAYWNGLSEAARLRAYGSVGYGKEKPELFVFVCPICDSDVGDTGHCVLISLDDQHIETMRHTSDFRAATEKEF